MFLINCNMSSSSQGRRKRNASMYLKTSDPKPSHPREGVIHLLIIEALSFFCALHIDANHSKSTLQKKMMHNLLTMQQDFTSYVDSRMSLLILESLIARDHDEIQRECADTPLEFLLEVCQNGCKDEESLRQLLNLLPYFFEYAIKYDYSPKRSSMRSNSSISAFIIVTVAFLCIRVTWSAYAVSYGLIRTSPGVAFTFPMMTFWRYWTASSITLVIHSLYSGRKQCNVCKRFYPSEMSLIDGRNVSSSRWRK